MRSIDDIIANACEAAAASLREAFALGGVERAIELQKTLETALVSVGPTLQATADDAIARDEHCRQEASPSSKPRSRAILLGLIAILTVALGHARAARYLPACALLIGLGALLRDWTEDGPSQ